MSLPLDTTASLSSNFVTQEQLQITSNQILTSGVFFLSGGFSAGGLFYGTSDFNINSVNTNGVTKTLVRNVDYWLVGQLPGVGAAFGGIFSAIFIADTTLAGSLYVTYRALGGVFVANQTQFRQFFSIASYRMYALNNSIAPQSAYRLQLSSSQSLAAAQRTYVVVTMEISYNYVTNTKTIPGTTGGTGGGSTGGGTGGGTGGTGTGTTGTYATNLTPGFIQLAGDLGGTAFAPTVPGLNNKQPLLVSGTNLKTLNSQNLLGAGDIPIKTIGGQSIFGSGDIAVSTTAITPAGIGAATAAQGVKADTAVQTINGKTGTVVTLVPADIGAITQAAADNRYASAAQGVLAASAYQKPVGGVPASDLSTAAQTQLTAASSAVQTVNGKSGAAVTLVAADVGALTQVAADARYLTISSGGYNLPIATASILGGVKIGVGLTTAGDGTISATGTTSPNASTTTPGIVQLAGDLAGTYTSPTVPGLADKQPTLVSATNIKTVGGKTILGAGDLGLTAADIGAATAAQGTLAASSVQAINGFSGNNITLSAGDLGAITQSEADALFAPAYVTQAAVSSVQSINNLTGNFITLTPADIGAATSAQGVKADSALQTVPVASASALGGVKVGSGLTVSGDGTISATGSSSPNASTTVPGIVQLAGDLGGTYTSPTVPGLANKQATLVSGTNLKTVGTKSLLGSGDLGLTAADVGALTQAVADVRYATAAQGALAATALQSIVMASSTVLGGIKIGTGLTIAGDGTVSATAASATNATTTAVGVVQLTGDLGGTATAPTVPGLAGKQAALVSGTNVKTVGNKSVLGAGDIGLTPSDIGAATAAQGDLAASALQSVPMASAIVLGGVKIGTGITIAGDGTISATGSTSPNASISTPGIVQLAGDLGGTYTSPTVPGLANKQATLVSGTNIKTVGNKTLLGSGDLGLTPSDIGAATAAQGALAVSALQSVAAATTLAVGTIQLAGDLGGTATAPTVPGLAGKQPTLVSGTNLKTVGSKTLLGSGDLGLVPADIGAATAAQGALAATALQAVPMASVTVLGGVKIGTGLTIAGDGTISATGSSSPNASVSTPGIVQLAGDLGGTYTSPTVPGLSGKQATLVSATNIKTVGSKSLLGSGDLGLTPADIGAATAAQGALAATALQSVSAATTIAVGTIQLAGDLGGTATSPTVPGLAGKQATLVSGTNIKTVGSKSIVGSGDIGLTAADVGALTQTAADARYATASQGALAATALQTEPTATSTVQGGIKLTGDLGGTAASPTVPGLAGKQATLVSGTNIKTVGSKTLLGAGDVGLLPSDIGAATAAQGALAATALQSVPMASATVLGGVKIGTGITIAGDGTISATAGGGGAVAFAAITGNATDNTSLSTALSTKVDKPTLGSTITASGNMSAAHVGKLIPVDTSAGAINLNLVTGVINTPSDKIIYQRRGLNPLTFTASGGAALANPHVVVVANGDFAIIMGTGVDNATVAGMPGDLVRLSQVNVYTASQVVAPVALSVVAGVVAISLAAGNNYYLPLSANATIPNPTNISNGQSGTIDVINAGNFTLAFGSMWKPVVGATTSVKMGAGSLSMISFKVTADGSKILYNILQES